MAVTRFIEDRTGWWIKKFVRTARRYRTVGISTGRQELTAEERSTGQPARRPRRDQRNFAVRHCTQI